MKDKNGNLNISMAIISGIDAIPPNMLVLLTLQNNGKLEIKQRFFKKEPFYLDYARITNAGMVTEKEILENDKSVIGRAAVGGLLLGPLGAVVGGMSGVGKKQKTQIRSYFVINYLGSNTSEPKVLTFQDKAQNLPGAIKTFTAELRTCAGLSDPEIEPDSHIL